MKKYILLLSSLFILHAQSIHAQTCTFSDNGTSTTYTLGNNDVLCITSGQFTGSILSLPSNAEIIVFEGATFNPSSLINASGLISNHGTVLFNTTNSLSDGFSIVNDSASLTEINAPQSFGGSFNITNDKAADILINVPLTLQAGSNFSNEGIVRANASFNADASTTFSNDGVMFIYGDATIGGIAYNGGIMRIYGLTNMTNTATFINKCTFLTENTLTNNSSKFENYGYIQVFTNGPQNNRIINNAEMYNDEDAIVQTTIFDNNSNVIGGGQFIALGETHNNGSFGFDGGGLNFYDATPTNSQVFDDQSMLPHVTVSRLQVGTFDTNYISSNCNKIAFPIAPNISLPVILNDFNAINKNCKPTLEWSTSQEINSSYFDIERKSTKDNGFTKVGRVNAQINSSTTSNYTFEDQAVENGLYQYRLKMVDLDGNTSYSRVASVTMFCGSETEVNLYPNPATSMLNITLQTNEEDNYQFSIINMMGQNLLTLTQQFNNGQNTVQVPVEHLMRGQYIVKITNNLTSKTIKFTKN